MPLSLVAACLLYWVMVVCSFGVSVLLLLRCHLSSSISAVCASSYRLRWRRCSSVRRACLSRCCGCSFCSVAICCSLGKCSRNVGFGGDGVLVLGLTVSIQSVAMVLYGIGDGFVRSSCLSDTFVMLPGRYCRFVLSSSECICMCSALL